MKKETHQCEGITKTSQWNDIDGMADIHGDPICGQDWLHKHWNDPTQSEIDALGIEIRTGDRLIGHVKAGEKEAGGIVKEIVKANK